MGWTAGENHGWDTGIRTISASALENLSKSLDKHELSCCFFNMSKRKDTRSAVLKQALDLSSVVGLEGVTIKRAGQLRGCIGTIVANEPLYQCVQRRAVDAAIHDSRFVFNPIKPAELSAIEIEISVLTPPQPAANPEEIVVGRDGVLLTLGANRGVFLPQVPVEQGWDRETYLSHLCGKAGLRDPDCFRHPNARLEKFQAIVFSEHEFDF